MSEYKTVWISKTGKLWNNAPNLPSIYAFGPFTEAKVVPADAIVIEADRVPRVRASNIKGGVVDFGGLTYTLDPEIAQSEAMHWLAVAEYLRANPTVDEAQAEALTKALTTAGADDPFGPTLPEIARRLVQAGVRVEVTE